jgi:hypothetical protein
MPHHIKAGTFYKNEHGHYLLAVGHLRHKPHTIFVILTSDQTDYEYNTGVYNLLTRTLCLAKGGAKYQLRPTRGEPGVYYQCRRKAQAAISPCYLMLDHDFVLKLPAFSALTAVPYHPQPPYTHVHQLYIRSLNEFTQSQSFHSPVTGCQLQASMSWIIARPPPAPLRMRASRTQECGGVAPNSAIYCRDRSGGGTLWEADDGLAANNFAVLMCHSEEDDDGV